MHKKLGLIFILVFFIFSCSKDENDGANYVELDTALEVVTAAAFFKGVYEVSKQEAEQAEKSIFSNVQGSISTIDSCALVEFYADTLRNYNFSLVINYPDSACSSVGRQKKGKLKIYLTGALNALGTVMTIIPERLYVNSKKVEGTIIATNVGYTADSSLRVELKVQNGKIWMTSSKFFTWNSTDSLELDSSTGSLHYTSHAEALNQNGLGYSVNSTERLTSDFTCDYFQSGELEIRANWGFTQKIKFGNGTCDDEAFLWEGGDSIQISLD